MTRMQIIDAGLQAAKDSVQWHKARNPKLDTVKLDAFAAGHSNGWHDAVAFLKLHGALKLSD